MKTKRQYRSNQGKSPERQSITEKILMIAMVGLILTLAIFAIIESI